VVLVERCVAEKRKLTRRQFIKRSLFAGGALVLTDALLEPELVKTTEVVAPISGLDNGLAGFRIGLISDVHYPRAISDGYIQGLCRTLIESRIDVAVLPGDFVDGKCITRVPTMKGLFDALGSVKYGVYGVLGNHDHWLDADGTRKELARSTPIELLECKHIVIERDNATLALGGIGDLWEGEVDVAKTFWGVDPRTPRILLSHNPDFAEENTEDVRIDLQVSGHTHGGEISTPWGWAPVTPSRYGSKFRYGFNRGKSHMCFTTSGVCSPRRLRLFCRPEVVVIELRPA
jgi:predicted MPP superfamily phosphohydrolase